MHSILNAFRSTTAFHTIAVIHVTRVESRLWLNRAERATGLLARKDNCKMSA